MNKLHNIQQEFHIFWTSTQNFEGEMNFGTRLKLKCSLEKASCTTDKAGLIPKK